MTSITKRRPAAERIAQIAASAEELALAEGLDALTLRALAARIGVAPALVAHYAPRMDVVVADAFSAITAAELAEVSQLAASVADPVERLAAVLATLRDGSREAVSLVWMTSWALGRRNEVLADAVRREMDAWRGFLADLVAALPGRAAADPLLVAGQILGMIDGLNAHALVGWNAPVHDELLPRAVEAMAGLPAGALQPPGAQDDPAAR